MAINRAQLRKVLEGDTKGQTMEQSLKKAKTETEKASVHQKKVMTTGGKEYSEEGLVKKTKRRMKELFYGKKAYMPGHKMIPVDKAKRKQEKQKSVRTSQVEGGLKQAGLSESDMVKFRSKK